jgi:hypothetical protein
MQNRQMPQASKIAVPTEQATAEAMATGLSPEELLLHLSSSSATEPRCLERVSPIVTLFLN